MRGLRQGRAKFGNRDRKPNPSRDLDPGFRDPAGKSRRFLCEKAESDGTSNASVNNVANKDTTGEAPTERIFTILLNFALGVDALAL